MMIVQSARRVVEQSRVAQIARHACDSMCQNRDTHVSKANKLLVNVNNTVLVARKSMFETRPGNENGDTDTDGDNAIYAIMYHEIRWDMPDASYHDPETQRTR